MALSKNAIIAICVAAIVVAGAGCTAAFAMNKDKGDSYPSDGVKVTTFTDYDGNTAEITFKNIPDRVVCGCNTALNLMLYLGLGDRIVGVYYDEEPVWDGVKDEYEKLVKRIGPLSEEKGSKHLKGNIQKDVLLSWEPDLVIGWVAWTDDALGSEKFWNDNGCNVMSLNTMSSKTYRTVSMMKTDYDNIGKIFNVSEKTEKLYNDTVDVINAVTAKVSGSGKTIYYALIDGAVTDNGLVWAYKDTNFIASILNSMGMKNALANVDRDDDGYTPLAKVYEAIGTTDIDVIFFIAYGNVTYEKSLKSWQDDADLSNCKAIKNKDTAGMLLSCSYGSTPQLLSAMNEVSDLATKVINRNAA